MSGTPSLTPVISSPVYVDDPAGLAVSADDSRLFLADRTARTIRVFDSGTTELLAELPLETSPHSLTAVSPGRYILNSGDRSTEPFLYLDTANPARMVFVPRAQ
jgi:DNA-binding beta-propeller fold protein YncE